MFKSRRLVVLSFSVLLVFGAACKKKVRVLPPPPPDTRGQVTPTGPDMNARPSVLAFSVEPSTIQAGQSATLRWNVTGANSVSIDQGVGQQSSTGTRQVSPGSSTTYTLTATGANGQSTATTTLTVTSAPAPPPTTAPNLSIEEMISRQVQDIYFDYDQFGVRDDARGILANDANALKAIFQKYPGASVIVEGHCDERGSAEYNLGLADKRSSSTRDYLVQLGVPADKLKTVSYGKERPQCNEATEECYQKNRRAHFAAAQ